MKKMTTEEAAKKLTEFRDEVNTAKSDEARADGELSQIEASLKKQGCKDIKEAEKVLAMTTKEREQLGKTIVEKVEKLEAEYEFE